MYVFRALPAHTSSMVFAHCVKLTNTIQTMHKLRARIVQSNHCHLLAVLPTHLVFVTKVSLVPPCVLRVNLVLTKTAWEVLHVSPAKSTLSSL